MNVKNTGYAYYSLRTADIYNTRRRPPPFSSFTIVFFLTENTVWKTLLHITTWTNIAVRDFFRNAFLDHLFNTKFYYLFHCVKIITQHNKCRMYNFKSDIDVNLSWTISSKRQTRMAFVVPSLSHTNPA